MTLPTMSHELYQEVILDHSRRPRNFGIIDDATHSARGHNPLCGDECTVFLKVDDSGTISSAQFSGHGCAISKAAASLLTEAIQGKTSEEVAAIMDEFQRLITGKLNPDSDTHSLGDLSVFCEICRYPSRVRCAGICCSAIRQALGCPSCPHKG
jgi:nitrogen fixation protein NifU and related proteins